MTRCAIPITRRSRKGRIIEEPCGKPLEPGWRLCRGHMYAALMPLVPFPLFPPPPPGTRSAWMDLMSK